MVASTLHLREMAREVHLFWRRVGHGQHACDWGDAWPRYDRENCRQVAVVRLRARERFDWEYYCREHTTYPHMDRALWEHFDSVQRYDGDAWVAWTDYDLPRPSVAESSG